MRTSSFALCFLVACAPAYPPLRVKAGQRNLDFKFNVLRSVLPNGMTVALLPDANANSVSVDMRYTVGSAAEPPEKAGLAHLVEHIAFTLRPGGRALDDWLRTAAFEYNAYTSKSETHYIARGFAAALPELLAIEAARLHPSCSLVSEEAFKRELEVVRNEMHLRQSDTRAALAAVTSAVYPAGHPLAHDVIGDEETLARITKADVCAFLLRHYIPTRATLIIAGPIDERRTLELVVTSFKTGKLEGPPPPQLSAATLDGRSAHVSLAVKEPRVSVTFAAPPRGTKDEVYGTVLQYALDKAARRVRREPFVVSSNVHWLSTEALWTFDIAVKQPNDRELAVEALFRAIDKVIFDLNAAWDDPTLFDYATLSFRSFRSDALTEEIQSLQNPRVRARTVADALTLANDPGYMTSRLTTLTRLDAASLHKMAVALLNRKRSFTLFVDPVTTSAPRPEQLTAHFDHRVSVAIGSADKPVEVPALTLQVHEETLANGMRIWFAPNRAFPLVNAALVFDGGAGDGPSPCTAELSARLLFPDASYSEVAAMQRVGGDITALVDRFATQFRIAGVSSYQDILLWQLGAWAVGGNYNRVPIDVSLVPGAKKEESDRKWAKARSEFFGLPTCEDPVRDYTLDAIETFHDKYFKPQRATLILTGSWNPDTIGAVRELYGAFEPLTAQTDAPPPNKLAARLGNRVGLVNERANQGHVMLSYALSEDPRERAAQLVLEALMDARVKRLRTDRAASYSVSASLSVAHGPQTLTISGDFDQGRADEAMQALREYIAKSDAFTSEFISARQEAVQRVLSLFSDSAGLANALYWLARAKLPLSAANAMLQDVASVTPAQVEAIIKRDLTEDRLSVLIEANKQPAVRAVTSFGGAKPVIVE